MGDNFKNIKQLGSFLDNTVGNIMTGLGCLPMIFIIIVPIMVIIVLVTISTCENGASHAVCDAIMPAQQRDK